jgi:hypothetical protein
LPLATFFTTDFAEGRMMLKGPAKWVAFAGTITSLLGASLSAQAKAYKGGEIFSTQEYQYGRMEMRMRMARGSGILSTFFTYKNGSESAATFWEEIDIEVFGKDDATTWQSNIITGFDPRATTEAVHTNSTSLADDYHTYVLEWTPEYVAWSLDGEEVRRVTTSEVQDLTSAQSLRFNLWAANIVSWVGEFDLTALPQYQYVNWISYSRYQDGQFIHEWTDEFDQFDDSRWGRADWTFGENLVDFDPNNVVIQDSTLVLALTHEGQTGFQGSVPTDMEVTIEPGAGGSPNMPGAGGTGGADPQGSGGASAGGADPQGSGGVSSGGSDASNTGGSTTGEGAGGEPAVAEASGGSDVGAPASGGNNAGDSGGAGPTSDPVDGSSGCTYPRSSLHAGKERRALYWLPLSLGALWVGRRRRRATGTSGAQKG